MLSKGASKATSYGVKEAGKAATGASGKINSLAGQAMPNAAQATPKVQKAGGGC